MPRASVPPHKTKILISTAPVLPARNLDVRSAAQYLGVTIWCIRSLVWKGKLKPLKLGNRFLFPREELDAFVERLKAEVV
jgi:excisionase family DNA binding protein